MPSIIKKWVTQEVRKFIVKKYTLSLNRSSMLISIEEEGQS